MTRHEHKAKPGSGYQDSYYSAIYHVRCETCGAIGSFDDYGEPDLEDLAERVVEWDDEEE